MKTVSLLIKPISFINRKKNIKKVVYIKNIKISHYVMKFTKPVKLHIKFFYKINNSFFINMKIKTNIIIKCVNCLSFYEKKFLYNYDINPLINNNDNKKDMIDLECLLQDKKVNIYKLLQDELYFHLPFLPIHKLKYCKKK